MPRFGVYYVPSAHLPFFRLGTSIIGYDARTERLSPSENIIRAQLPNFDPAHVMRPQHHGIHCTIVAPHYCRYGDLETIHYDIDHCLRCFEAETAFELHAKSPLVEFWGKKQQIVTLQYSANTGLQILHTLLVAQLNKYIRPKTTPSRQQTAHEFHRAQHFHYPFLFDSYKPHFTLMHPYKGDDHAELAHRLHTLFGQFKVLTFESICLMVQPHKKAQWQIYHEYLRRDYPPAI